MRWTLAATLTMAVLATLSSAQTPRSTPQATPARAEINVPFRVGETLTFDVAYSTYLVAGTATSTVIEKKPSDNSTAYLIVAEGRPLPMIARIFALYYKMDTLFDSVSGLSQRSSLYTEEGTRRRTATTQFDRRARKATFTLEGGGNASDVFAIPPDVQDGLSTLYALRARPLRAGERFTMSIADDGVVYTAAVETTGPEHLKLRLGEFDAWNLKLTVTDPKGEPVGKNMAVWLSTDARRLPLKLQADLPVGSFVLALKDVR
jgi:hypothetical protein